MKEIEISKLKQLRLTTTLVVVLMYLSIVIGGLLSQIGEGMQCLGGFLCLGSGLPPQTYHLQLSYYHFLIISLTFPLYLWNTFLILKYFRKQPVILLPQLSSGVLMLRQASILFDWLPVPPAILPFAHYLLAVLSLLFVTTTAVAIFSYSHHLEKSPSINIRSRFSRLAILVFFIVVVVSISGLVVSMSGGTGACQGWPLCEGGLDQSNTLGFINLIHRMIVAVGGLFILILFRQAWRTQRTQRAILTTVTIMSTLFFSQGFVGAVKQLQGSPFYFVALHEGTSVALLVASIVMIVFVALAGRTDEEEALDSAEKLDGKVRAKDFLTLTKPIVVLLLLFTTYGGMVIGAKAFPSLSLTFWTILGGALAAGGSGAVNQYIDRHIDLKMTRTAMRPIPSGRMMPAEGLAFGAGLLIIAFYLLASYVNLMAALLSLSGMFYYVILYSVFLKKATEQNIVIGGGAGAIPPMVGYAAVTGSLSLMPWLLFLIIFLWTPPHFWALALTRKGEYAKAGIPMLPVVKGDKETRKQIWIYTWVLIAGTLLPYVFTLMGTIYLIGALLLGAWLLHTAYQVYSKEGNKVAFRMYRYSSMYLMFLFIVMMIDAVV